MNKLTRLISQLDQLKLIALYKNFQNGIYNTLLGSQNLDNVLELKLCLFLETLL